MQTRNGKGRIEARLVEAWCRPGLGKAGCGQKSGEVGGKDQERQETGMGRKRQGAYNNPDGQVADWNF